MVTERKSSYFILPRARGEEAPVTIIPETSQVSLEALLIGLYWGLGMSMGEIGKLIHKDQVTISRYFKKLKIGVRSPQEYLRLPWRNPERGQAHSEAMKKNWQGNTKRKEQQRELAKKLLGRPESKAKRKETMRQKARAKMEQVLGINPKKTLKQLIRKEGLNNKQIAQGLGVSTHQVKAWEKSFGIEISGISHPRINQANKNLFQRAKKSGLLTRLTSYQWSVLEKRYGEQPASLSEIAKSRGVTRETVSLTEQRALEKLRKLLAS